MDYSPPGSSVHGDSAGKNTGVDYHTLLQGIFPAQDWNHISGVSPALAGGFFTTGPSRSPWGCKRVRHDLATKQHHDKILVESLEFSGYKINQISFYRIISSFIHAIVIFYCTGFYIQKNVK